ncbi:DUF433 domain-containing protein [Bradyrhizobium sp. Arg816]|uniref:DUF433 domain-containing protein n=1 Tax=Bradyrhizobium sp. Arg816 TaxID=2998491 RepID=UPI00249DCE61|nr:DUF433 domain-containing protein [Bradyrhizobium sp. Arg816]MDI3559834.1 DUF433 domain-containing protein [Bradyrhizobium sp. Arg816]
MEFAEKRDVACYYFRTIQGQSCDTSTLKSTLRSWSKPVIRGTRVPVELVLHELEAGMATEAIIAEHPRLTPDDVRAAQAFATDHWAAEDIFCR